MRKNLSLVVVLLVLIVSVSLMSHSSIAEEVTAIKTVYLGKENSIEPRTIVRTHDGGFIVAGLSHSLGTPWVIKTDSEGNLKWKFLPDKEPQVRMKAGYSSAVVMPDDSVFLCGGKVTHLDKNGNLLSEKSLHPEGFEKGGLTSCSLWKGTILAVGRTSRLLPLDEHAIHKAESFYWVAALDRNGRKKWEKVQPISERMHIMIDGITGPLVINSQGDFVFVARRNGMATEVVKVKTNGDIKTKIIDNIALSLVSDTDVTAGTTKDIQLISVNTGSLTGITLDDNLQETGRINGESEGGEAPLAYRLPDQSLVLFGAKARGIAYDARIMHLDPAFKIKTSTLVNPQGEAGFAHAAVPLDEPGKFVVARWITDPENQGLALDFVSVEP